MLNQSCAADQAHLRSHSGPGASDVLCGCPSKPEFRIEPGLLSGRLKTRGLAPERTLARVCREAGATVRYNAKLRDMDLAVSANNDRAIEVLATVSLCTLVPNWQWTSPFGAPLLRTVQRRPGAARMDGAVCTRAREDKERKHSELLRADRCRLVVVALETGGRWSEESLQFVESLAAVRARDAPPALFHSAALAWRRRWARMIAVSCAPSQALGHFIYRSSAPWWGGWLCSRSGRSV